MSKNFRFLSAFVALVAILGTTAVAGETRDAEAQSSPQTTRDFVGNAVPAHFQAGIGQPGESESREIARNNDVIIAHWRTFKDHGNAMRQANPDIQRLVYQKGATASVDNEFTYPESWYLRNARGEKVQSDPWGSYLMDPRVQGWRDTVVDDCEAALVRSGYDGCYFDVLGVGALAIVSSKPVFGPGGREISKAEWHDMMMELANHIRSNIDPDVPLMGNGLGAGRRYFEPAFPAAELADELGEAHAEVWLRTGFTSATNFRSLEQYRQDLEMLPDLSARGHRGFVTTKLWAPATQAQRTQWRNLAYASFLLATDGSHLFAFTGEESTMELEHPLYDLDIGVPTGDYSEGPSGVFERRFESGIVLTNGDAQARTVSLPSGSFYDVENELYTGSVRLAPHTGIVLREGSIGRGDGAVDLCGGETPTILGTHQGERIIGTPGRDVILGRGGNDVIEGRGGDDLICGGGGNDRLYGGDGSDRILGGGGDDLLRGQFGDDVLIGGPGTDQCFGSYGTDRGRLCESEASVP